MGPSVRVILLNMDLEYAPTLRGQLSEIDGVKVVAEIDDPAMLMQAVEQFRSDMVVLQLDPQPEMILSIAENAISSHPDLPMIAISESCDGNVVLKAMRAGIREYLERPLKMDVLEEAIGKIASTRPERSNQGKLITMIGSTGGVGATLLTTNLAVELAELEARIDRPDRVIVVDLDFRFGQVAACLDLQPHFTIAELCETHEQLDPQIIDKAALKHSSGLHVLARPESFEQADTITAAHTAAVLGALQDIYDYVLVDGPHRFDPAARAVLDLADVNYLVIQLLVPSIRNARRMLDAMKEGGYNTKRVSLICNRFIKGAGQLTIEHAEATLGTEVAISIPDDWKSCSTVMNLGEPLMLNHSKRPVTQSIHDLAEMIAQPEDEDEEIVPSKKKGGLLGKIFSDSVAS